MLTQRPTTWALPKHSTGLLSSSFINSLLIVLLSFERSEMFECSWVAQSSRSLQALRVHRSWCLMDERFPKVGKLGSSEID